MNDYGYRTITSVSRKSDDELNELVRQGWQLVGFTHDGQVYVYIFYKIKLLNINAESVDNMSNSGVLIMTPPAEATAPKRFMFKTALTNLGVSPQLAADWIKVRQAKKAAQTETAFKTVATQLKIVMDNYGVTADDVVRVAVERNWQGIMARYYENIDWSEYGTKVGQTDLPFDKQKWE